MCTFSYSQRSLNLFYKKQLHFLVSKKSFKLPKSNKKDISIHQISIYARFTFIIDILKKVCQKM